MPPGNTAAARRRKKVIFSLVGLWLSAREDRSRVDTLPVKDLLPILFRELYPVTTTAEMSKRTEGTTTTTQTSAPPPQSRKRKHDQSQTSEPVIAISAEIDYDEVVVPKPKTNQPLFAAPENSIILDEAMSLGLADEIPRFETRISVYPLRDTQAFYRTYKGEYPFITMLAKAVFSTKTQNGGLERKMKPLNDIKSKGGDQVQFSRVPSSATGSRRTGM